MIKLSRQTCYGLAFLLLLVIFGSFLRIETLTRRPLWHDEVYTGTVIQEARSLRDIWEASGRDGGEHPLLYYSAAYLTHRVLGSERLIRLPACVAGILSIVLIAILAAQLFGPRIALLAALQLTLSVYHIEYSQDARPYSLLIFWSLLSALGLLCYVRTTKINGLILFGLSSLAALYTHHTGLFVLSANAVSGCLFMFHRWYQTKRFPLYLLAGFGVTAGLVLIGFYPQIAHLKAYLATANLNESHTLALTLQFFTELFNRWSFGEPWGVICLVLFLIGVIRASFGFERWALLLPWFLIPFFVFGFRPFNKFFDIRFVIAAFPPFLILCGAGLDLVARFVTQAMQSLCRLTSEQSTVLGKTVLSFFIAGCLVSALVPYLDFRRLTDRCDNFFYRPELMKEFDGICERQLILNSLWPDHNFILVPITPSKPQ